MKINNKGFTFVEILAVIVLIGILTGISIAAFTRYKDNAVKSDYEALARASYNAMEEYMMSHPYDNTVSLKKLEDENLLSNRKDPGSKDTDCTGTVEVSKNSGSNGKLDDGEYKVHLCCVSYKKTYTYPGGKVTDLEDMSNCDYEPEEPPGPNTTYTLYYNDNKGSGCSSKSITKKAGEEWGPLCTPTRSGYTFVDWNYGTETILPSSIAEENITVKAEWKSTSTKYTLKYDDNEGSGCSSESITKKKDEEWGTLCTPTRTGYTFNDWYDDSTKYTSTTKATKNVTVKANWTPKQYTLKVTNDSNINSVKIDGESIKTKTVDYGTTVNIETKAIDYYHPLWDDDNTITGTRSFKVLKDTTLTVNGTPNIITINYYSNGGSLQPNPSQSCPVEAGCKPADHCGIETDECRNKSRLVKTINKEYSDTGYSYSGKGMPNYDTTSGASLYMTRSGCTGTHYWHIGSATSGNKIHEDHTQANSSFNTMADFANDSRVGKGELFKKENISIDVYAGWNCPSSITCAAGKYLPKNKTTCATCIAGYYCEGGIFKKNTTKNQGIKVCPTAYSNSNAGSSKITNCYMKVAAGNYIKEKKATTATKCPANKYRIAHNVNYDSTSSCGNCPSSYPKSAAGSTAATKCYRTNVATFTYLRGAETWNGYANNKVTRSCNQYNGQANCQVIAPNHIDMPGQSHCKKQYKTLIINKGWNKTMDSATGGIGTGAKINITGNVTYYSTYLPNTNYLKKNTALKVDGADNSHLSIGGTSDGKSCGKGSPNVYNRNQPKEDGFNTYHSYTLENAYIFWSGTWLVNTENNPYDENYLYIVGIPMNAAGKNSKADKVCKEWKSLTNHYNEFANCPSSAYIKALQLTW